MKLPKAVVRRLLAGAEGAAAKAPGKAALTRRAKAPEPVVVTPRWYTDERESVLIVLPGLKTINELNNGTKWYEVRGKRGLGPGQILAARGGVDGWLSDPGHRQEPAPPYTILLTRVAPSGGLDRAGLWAALKRVQDGVAAALGIDDGPDDPSSWDVDQRAGPFSKAPKAVRYAVEIRISWKEKSE